MMTWKQFLARTSVQGVVIALSVGVGVGIANAVVSGRSGGHTRSALTIAGTLTGVTGTASATFTITNGSGLSCTPPAVQLSPTAGGSFSTEIDIENCPTSIFDGSNASISATVTAGGTSFNLPASSINPVPYAVYAQQYGTPDCPVGYRTEHDTTFTDGMILCIRRDGRNRPIDHIVRVGWGPSVFWIDRYEASVFSDQAGATRAARSLFDTTGTLPPNAQYSGTTQQLFAYSQPNQLPETNLTWFQASELCRMAGKRLPTGDEWLAAARGSDRAGTACLTSGMVLRNTSDSSSCRSFWGAVDMVGNVFEWTGEWAMGTRSIGGDAVSWPVEVGGGSVGNIGGSVSTPAGPRSNLPGAVIRGGSAESDTGNAGVFSMSAGFAPSSSYRTVGFRCVIPR